MQKQPSKRNKASLVSLPVTGPFDRVAADVLGPLPMTQKGNKYVIIFTEYLTKFSVAQAIPAAAETSTDAFLHEIVLKHGAPLQLLSGKGSNFMLDLLERIHVHCVTRKINTPSCSYHAQCDSLVEHENYTVAATLPCMSTENRMTGASFWVLHCLHYLHIILHDKSRLDLHHSICYLDVNPIYQ